MRQLHKSTGTMVVLAVLISACSSGGRHYGNMSESLEIDILPNDSKIFVYRLEYPNAHDPSRVQIYHPRVNRERERPRARNAPDERTYRYLQNKTERALAVTGYCREGYLELDRRLAYHTLWLRGECREGATVEDRTNFGDREQLAIPEQ